MPKLSNDDAALPVKALEHNVSYLKPWIATKGLTANWPND